MRKGLSCLPHLHMLKSLPSSKAQLSFHLLQGPPPLCQETIHDSSEQLRFAEPKLYANPYVICLHSPFNPRESSCCAGSHKSALWSLRNLDSKLDPATAFGKSLKFSLRLRSPKLVLGYGGGAVSRVPSTHTADAPQEVRKPPGSH